MQQNFFKMNSKIILTFSFDKSWIQELVPQLYYVLVIVLTNTENFWLDNSQLAESVKRLAPNQAYVRISEKTNNPLIPYD